LEALLERDTATRLGARGTDEVQRHAFFDGFEWQLLRAQLLPSPFVPDAGLVYAKDIVPALSLDDLPAPAPRDDAAWQFSCDARAYDGELAQLVRKYETRQLLQLTSEHDAGAWARAPPAADASPSSPWVAGSAPQGHSPDDPPFMLTIKSAAESPVDV